MFYWIEYHTGCQLDMFVSEGQEEMVEAVREFIDLGYTIVSVTRKNYR